MQFRNSAERYGAIPKALHWTIAVLVIVAWVLGTLGEELPRGVVRVGSEFIHVSAGLAILALLVFRFAWRLGDSPPPLESTPFGRWGDYAANAGHWLLYVLLGAAVLSGIVAQFADSEALPVFGLFEIPSPWAKDHGLAEAVEEAHEILANALVIVAGLHTAAALAHHWLLRDRTLVRMLPGGAH
jgi:cytochrome b561